LGRDCVQARVALIMSGASGDHNSTDKDSGTFQNLLPSNHGLYGAMDLSSLQNIIDWRLSATIKPSAKTSLALDLHNNTSKRRMTIGTMSQAFRGTRRERRRGAARASASTLATAPTSAGSRYCRGWTVVRGLLLEAGVGHFFG